MRQQPVRRLIAGALVSIGVLWLGVLYREWQSPDPSDAPVQFSEPVAPVWSSATNNPRRPPQLPESSTAVSVDDWSSLQIGERIEFDLPSSDRYVGVITEARQGRVATSFSGNLEVDKRFHFTLTAGSSARFGTINTPVGVIEVETIGGVTWMYRRDALPGASDSMQSDVVLLPSTPVLEEPPAIGPPPPPETNIP